MLLSGFSYFRHAAFAALTFLAAGAASAACPPGYSCADVTSGAAAAPVNVAPIPPYVSMEVVWGPKEALRQSRLLSAALDALKPGVAGKREAYVLSAGLWGEHVFDNEAAGAADVLSKRYGAEGRTIVLSNGAASLGKDRPAATPLFLQAALARVGEAMNTKEDVLFLFLTSHGGPDSGVGVFEEKRLQAQLTPARLKAMLDETGIKNRVVILSACFSGAFIPALQDENTIVLAAAAADRRSFGCQPERDWTYFGDAMFATTMPEGLNLLEAFEQSKILIRMWEGKLGAEPSNPTSFVGASAAKYLAEIEKAHPPVKTLTSAAAPN